MNYNPLKSLNKLIDRVLDEITVKDDETYEYLRRQASMEDAEPPESFVIENEIGQRNSNKCANNGVS